MYKAITNQDNEIYVTDNNEMLSFDAVTVKELDDAVTEIETKLDNKVDKTAADLEHAILQNNIDSETSRASSRENELLLFLQNETSSRLEERNEINAQIDDINSKIPTQASYINQLADKEFVNSSINSSAANFKGNFPTKAALDAVAWQTSDETLETYVHNNDYAYIEEDETHNNESWRYIYVLTESVSQWQPQFKVSNAPFTAAQLAAINSGATSELIDSIPLKLTQNSIIDSVGNSSTKAISQNAATLGIQTVDNKFNSYMPLSGGTLTGTLYSKAATPLYIGYNGKVGMRAVVEGQSGHKGQMNISNAWYDSEHYGAQMSAKNDETGGYNAIRISHNGPQYFDEDDVVHDIALKEYLDDYLPLSGGTLTGPVVLSGGDAITGVGNIQLDADGQITAKDTTSTLFGRTATFDLAVGHRTFNLKLRGKQTRPTYNDAAVALQSDVPTNYITDINTSGNALTINKSNGDVITYQGSLTGGETIDVTDTTPSSGTMYYPLYTTGRTTGQTVRANQHLYYYDAGSWSSLNLGAAGSKGILTIHTGDSSGDNYVDISPNILTANRTLTAPDKSGTIAITSDIPTNYVTTDSDQPIDGEKTFSKAIVAPQFKCDNTEAGMYFGENNELDFGSNTNVLYIGYANRLGTSGTIDTYYFGNGTGSSGWSSGKIHCGELFEGGSSLNNKYVNLSGEQTISGNKTLSGTVRITGTLIV